MSICRVQVMPESIYIIYTQETDYMDRLVAVLVPCSLYIYMYTEKLHCLLSLCLHPLLLF